VRGFWEPAAGGFHFAGLTDEPVVVVGDELAQHGVSSVDVGRLGQSQFAGEAILQHTQETFDAAFGLRAVGGEEGDAELFQCAAELGGLAFSGELFFDGPVIVVADEDSAVVAVNSQQHTAAAQQLAKQARDSRTWFLRGRTGRPGFSQWRRPACQER
jgi:hypothetical protein